MGFWLWIDWGFLDLNLHFIGSNYRRYWYRLLGNLNFLNFWHNNCRGLEWMVHHREQYWVTF